MDEIIKNIIVTVLVLFVMRLITFGAERSAEQARKDEEEVKSGKRGKKNSKNPLVTGKVTIQYDIGTKILIILCFIFPAALTVVSIGDCFWDWTLGQGASMFTIIGSFLFTLLGAVCVGGVVLWRIRIDGDDIEYSDYLGIRHHYKFGELDRVVIYQKKVVAYRNGHRIFTIDDNVPNGCYFDSLAQKKGVNVVFDKKYEEYLRKKENI